MSLMQRLLPLTMRRAWNLSGGLLAWTCRSSGADLIKVADRTRTNLPDDQYSQLGQSRQTIGVERAIGQLVVTTYWGRLGIEGQLFNPMNANSRLNCFVALFPMRLHFHIHPRR